MSSVLCETGENSVAQGPNDLSASVGNTTCAMENITSYPKEATTGKQYGNHAQSDIAKGVAMSLCNAMGLMRNMQYDERCINARSLRCPLMPRFGRQTSEKEPKNDETKADVETKLAAQFPHVTSVAVARAAERNVVLSIIEEVTRGPVDLRATADFEQYKLLPGQQISYGLAFGGRKLAGYFGRDQVWRATHHQSEGLREVVFAPLVRMLALPQHRAIYIGHGLIAELGGAIIRRPRDGWADKVFGITTLRRFCEHADTLGVEVLATSSAGDNRREIVLERLERLARIIGRRSRYGLVSDNCECYVNYVSYGTWLSGTAVLGLGIAGLCLLGVLCGVTWTILRHVSLSNSTIMGKEKQQTPHAQRGRSKLKAKGLRGGKNMQNKIS